MKTTNLIDTLLANSEVRSATYYVTPKLVSRVTWRHRPRKGDRRMEFVVTVGEPNYLERAFVKKAKAAKEPFPVKKFQLRLWPKKKTKK